ncbi:MAG: glycosyltransferase [Patescibacteria group bacterium]
MTNKKFEISVIIPLYVIKPQFFRDLKKFLNQSFKNFEILVVCDQNISLPRIKGLFLRKIITGQDSTGPATKRDIALKYVKGKICAFIDDDAYPHPNWLKNAFNDFNKLNIIAVGGPGVTPPEDGYWEKLAGLVYESIFCSGKAQRRFVPTHQKYVDDWPAYNLLINTDILNRVGGYGNDFYGGEDTFLCLKLIKEGKIYYDPKVVVYHHRRRLFIDLLKQIFNIGIHRGYFAKKFPETSRQIFYFLPSILLIGFFLFLIGSFFNTGISLTFSLVFLFFLILGAASVFHKTDISSSFLVGLGIIATHLTYGTGFIKGLLTKNLTR